MKKTVFKTTTLLFLICVAATLKAQSLDTLTYLKIEIEAQKGKYINKPFSALLADLKLQPLSVFSKGDMKNKKVEKETKFYYSVGGAGTGAPYILITWSSPILLESGHAVLSSNNWLFSSQVKDYYSSKIIKDILVEKSFHYKPDGD